MAANSEHGRVAITLAGKSYTMTTNYQAALEIEERIGEGILTLARRAGEGNIGLREATAIITAGLRAGGEPATPDKVGAMIMADGLLDKLEPVAAYLIKAIAGETGTISDATEAQTDQPEAADSR